MRFPIRLRRAGICVSALSLIVLIPQPSAALEVRLETIVLEGDPAPEFGDGVVVFGCRNPGLGANGDVAFTCALNGLPLEVANAMFRVAPDGERIVILQRGDEPGVLNDPVWMMSQSRPPNVSADGSLAFWVRTGTAGSTTFGSALIHTFGDVPVPIAISGEPASGAPATNYLAIGIPTGNSSGRVAFKGVLEQGLGGTDDSNDQMIWWVFEGDVDVFPVARLGADPQDPDDTRWSLLQTPRVGEDGSVFFTASLERDVGGVQASNGTGLWQQEPNGARILRLRQGDPTPARELDAAWGSFIDLNYATNLHGDIAFSQSLNYGGDVGPDDNDTVWGPDASGELVLLARQGDPAPDIPNATFGPLADSFQRPIRVNDARQVVFPGRLALSRSVTEDDDLVIWGTDTSGLPSPWIREGDTVPGRRPTRSLIEPMNPWQILNDGTLLFTATLRGLLVEDAIGLLARDPEGGLSTVLYIGQTLEIGPEDLRTVDDFSIGAINAQGDVSLRITFADPGNGTSGIFVASIPEPAGTLAGVTALMSVAALARRRARGRADSSYHTLTGYTLRGAALGRGRYCIRARTRKVGWGFNADYDRLHELAWSVKGVAFLCDSQRRPSLGRNGRGERDVRSGHPRSQGLGHCSTYTRCGVWGIPARW